MKKIYFVLFVLFMQSIHAQSETTIYLIRHAEKADSSPNTDLSKEGEKRAKAWATYFQNTSIDMIYSTPYLRTQATCLPIAISKQKEVISYNPKEMDLKKLIAENPGKIILIAGHSNTIPQHINQLLGEEKYPEILESEFGNLYILKIKSDDILHTLIKI